MANGSRSEKLEKFYKHVEEEQDEQASIGIDVLDVGALAASYAATSHVHHHSTAPSTATSTSSSMPTKICIFPAPAALHRILQISI